MICHTARALAADLLASSFAVELDIDDIMYDSCTPVAAYADVYSDRSNSRVSSPRP